MANNAILLGFSLLQILVLPFQCYGGKSYMSFDMFKPLKDSLSIEFNASSLQFAVNIRPQGQEGLKAYDKIERLPGQPEGVDFDQYSGYVNVDENAGRTLFYYFVESPQNASSKPLVLWLNGGPGCSSLGAGALTELGPFRVKKDGKTLYRNPYAWHQEANIIFLESPAGVGFSYSNNSSDYNVTGDVSTARDSYTFIVNWLERFPEYKNRDFFIAGESYAGHYVPQLTQLILHNNKFRNHTIINLKGITIGNGVLDDVEMVRGTVDFAWSHALLPDEIYYGLYSNCNLSISDPHPSTKCKEFFNKTNQVLGHIFAYDIYAPICNSTFSSNSISEFDPCSSDYVFNYLNNPEVQTALHVAAAPYPWQLCNQTLHGHWADSPLTVLPIIKELMASGIQVWIYSGDTDGAVPITCTRYAINKLGLAVKTPWYPWYYQNEVGGFVVEYEKLTFVTVKGSGHFVPSYQPARALLFFSSFLAGKLLPPAIST
ncbi:hypothetical protein M9H77_31324 [Catharanthus roseus]|uniref:Uncharacterized protein n=1 Tax=Catharanthus roseus TaxID=4058 RepID=A0ACC0A2E7_CATRO|nr:hypothetical protein M9H77_31324 [Catharanthus roseus]